VAKRLQDTKEYCDRTRRLLLYLCQLVEGCVVVRRTAIGPSAGNWWLADAWSRTCDGAGALYQVSVSRRQLSTLTVKGLQDMKV